ncbi:hypothetical protein ACNR9Q_10710 [Maribacter sp. X9]
MTTDLKPDFPSFDGWGGGITEEGYTPLWGIEQWKNLKPKRLIKK